MSEVEAVKFILETYLFFLGKAIDPFLLGRQKSSTILVAWAMALPQTGSNDIPKSYVAK